MQLNQLSIVNYKNIELADLNFSANVNCFVGMNGMGKTNLLDAIYYLSFCKSSSVVSDSLNIRHDADFFMIQGSYSGDDGGVDKVNCAVKRGGRKRIKCNDKDCKRFSEHVGKIPLVMISPSDSLLVTGGSEERRKFMDTVISQYEPGYLEHIIRYDKALKQRNALLKAENEPDWNVVEVLEDMMSGDAKYIFHQREAFVKDFIPIFQQIYNALCNSEKEMVTIEYLSHGFRGDLKPILVEGRVRERIIGYTLHGVHKDELQLLFNGFPIKQEGSQGQAKTYFIAMKLAQFVFLKRKGEQRVPILLLDDIFDKLDAGRVGRIIDYVSGNDFGQIFITDTNREHLDCILSSTAKDYRLFTIADGKVENIYGTQEV